MFEGVGPHRSMWSSPEGGRDVRGGCAVHQRWGRRPPLGLGGRWVLLGMENSLGPFSQFLEKHLTLTHSKPQPNRYGLYVSKYIYLSISVYRAIYTVDRQR